MLVVPAWGRSLSGSHPGRLFKAVAVQRVWCSVRLMTAACPVVTTVLSGDAMPFDVLPSSVRRATTAARCRRALVAVCAAGVCCVPLAACDRFSAAHDAPAGTQQSAPAAPGDPGQPNATADADGAVLSAYRGFWGSAVAAWSRGSLEGVSLDSYASGDAGSGVRAALDAYRRAGVVTQGRPVLDPRVSALDLSASPYTATVSDCVDESGFFTVRKGGGARSAAAAPGRHPAVYRARYGTGGWVIVSGSVDVAGTC